MVLNQDRRVEFGKLLYQHLMGEHSNTIEEEYRKMIHMKSFLTVSVQPIPKLFGFRSDKCDDLIATIRSLLRWQTMHCLVCQFLLVMLPSSVYSVLWHLSRISLATKCFLKARMRLHESGQRRISSRSACCKDLSLTERMFQLFATENTYQFDEEQNRETRNRAETRSRKT